MTFVYYFEPPPDDKRGLGNFLIVIEIMAKRQISGDVADSIIKTLGEVYYNQDSGDIIDDRFETALNKVNKNYRELTEKKDIDLDAKISAVVAVIADDIIHLSSTGNCGAVLFRNGNSTDMIQATDESSPVATDKLFHNVSSGRLEENDKLIFGSPAIFFHFQADELKQLVNDNSPKATVAKISTLVSPDDNASRFGAVMVELLTPAAAANQTIDADKSEVMVGTPPSLAKEAREIAEPTAKKAAKKSAHAAKQVKDWSKNKLVPTVKEKTKLGWNTLWTKYINPNPKLALAIAAALILMFIGFSVFLTSSPKASNTQLVAFKEVIALTDTAEAKLTLGQKNEASEAIQSAEKKLNAIIANKITVASINAAVKRDPDLRNKTITVETLQQRIDLLGDKIAGIAHVKPELVYSFKASSGAKLAATAYLGDEVYTVDSAKGILYKVSPTNKTAAKVGESIGLKKTTAITTGSNGDSIYILTSVPSVLVYKPASGLSEVELSAGDWEAGDDIASYVGNLYILSRQDGQIWRHTPTAIGFSARSGWLDDNENNDAKSTVSLAVNGNIFLLSEQNKMAMFSGGKKAEFDSSQLPKLDKKPTKMLIDADKNQIYILSSEDKKIYSISLEGQGATLQKQYALDGISDIKGFSWDKNKSQIYVITTDKVVKFTP